MKTQNKPLRKTFVGKKPSFGKSDSNYPGISPLTKPVLVSPRIDIERFKMKEVEKEK